MKVIKRTEVNSPYGSCVECTVGTRSHVLEYPDYEEFEEEIPEEFQEYQGRKKHEEEEPQILIRYRRLNDPTVICHKCWIVQRAKAVTFLEQRLEGWLTDIPTNASKARKFLKDWQYFDFSSLKDRYVPQPKKEDLSVQDLQRRVKAFFIGAEEE